MAYDNYNENSKNIPNGLFWPTVLDFILYRDVNSALNFIRVSEIPTNVGLNSANCSWSYNADDLTWGLTSDPSQIMKKDRTRVILATIPANFSTLDAAEKALYQWQNTALPQSGLPCNPDTS